MFRWKEMSIDVGVPLSTFYTCSELCASHFLSSHASHNDTSTECGKGSYLKQEIMPRKQNVMVDNTCTLWSPVVSLPCEHILC